MFENLGQQLLWTAIVSFCVSLLMGELDGWQMGKVSLAAWGGVAFLSVPGSIIAFVAYTWLLQEMPDAIVSTYAYMNPVIAVALGFLIMDGRTNHQPPGYKRGNYSRGGYGGEHQEAGSHGKG